MNEKFQYLVGKHELEIGALMRLLVEKGVITFEEVSDAQERVYREIEEFVDNAIEKHVSGDD